MRTKLLTIQIILTIFSLFLILSITPNIIAQDEHLVAGTTPTIPIPIPTPSSTTNIDETITTEQDITQKIGLTGGNTAIANKVQISRQGDGAGKVIFQEGGTLTIRTKTPDGKTIEHSYSGLQKSGDNNPQISVDKNGKIVEASFTTTRKQTIVLGNEILRDLPPGTEINFKNGKATIKQPKGTIILPPKETLDNKLGESIFYFEYKNSNQFGLPNGDKFYGKQLGFKQGKLFFDVTEAKIGEDIQISNPQGLITYIDFEGKPNLDYDSAYISVNRNKKIMTIGMNTQGKGPSYLISSNSDFAKDITGGKDNIAVQAYSVNGEKSFVYFKERSTSKKSARTVTLNGVNINQDGKSPYYNVEKKKFLVKIKKNLITEFTASGGYVPIEIAAYRSENNDYNNLINVFGQTDGKDNVMVIGDDGRMAIGPNPGFIPVKSSTYSSWGEKGLFKGVSHWLAYNEPPSKETFKRFLGRTLNDPVGIPPKHIKMLMDVFGNAPRAMLRDVKTINIANHWAGWAGLARPGQINLHWGNGGVDPGTAIHEITHVHDFNVGWSRGSSKFDRQWDSVGGSDGPHTYGYGYTGGEDTSTFAQMVYKDSWSSGSRGTFTSWKYALSPEYSYHKQIRARVAVFYWNKFITRSQASRILGQAGLSADDASLNKYYNEAIKS